MWLACFYSHVRAGPYTGTGGMLPFTAGEAPQVPVARSVDESSPRAPAKPLVICFILVVGEVKGHASLPGDLWQTLHVCPLLEKGNKT